MSKDKGCKNEDQKSEIAQLCRQYWQEDEELRKWIETAIREDQEALVIKFHKEKRELWCSVNEIVYLKAEGSYVRVYTNSGNFCVSRNLKYWGKKVEKGKIIRNHKSYMINLEYVDFIKEKVAIKGRSECLPIGRKYKKELVTEYEQFLKKNIK